MFPSKSMVDYMNEMDRLFPRTNENDYVTHPCNNQYVSPFSHSALANRSSSSADSTSPESYNSFMSVPYSTQELHRQERGIHETPRAAHEREDIPFQLRRQRPIVGRKIMSNQDHMPMNYDSQTTLMKTDRDFEVPNYTWQSEDSLIQSTPLNYTNNAYELFPAENKGFDFSTIVNTSPNSTASNFSRGLTSASPNMTNISPSQSAMPLSFTNPSPSLTNMSPSLTNMSPSLNNMPPSLSNMSPNPTHLSPKNIVQQKYSPPNFSPNFSSPVPYNINRPNYGTNLETIPQRYHQEVREMKNPKLCTFCRKNGETPMVYMKHSVKEKVGNRHVVTCPILRSHICSTCGASGDDAHTITYCPILRSCNNGLPIPSTTITLKNTRVKSNGRRRF